MGVKYGLLGDSLVEAKDCFLTLCHGMRLWCEQSKVLSKCRELNWLSKSVKANSGLRKDLLVL